MKQLLPHFPHSINTYFEPFCGGGSSFLNVSASKYILNDIDTYMVQMHNMLNKYAKTPQEFFDVIKKIEDKYGLSASYRQDIIPEKLKAEFVKTYFARFNKEGYAQMRKDFNQNKTNFELLYLLLIYGFNRMLRFNTKGDFNLPVGNVDLNQNVINALDDYFNFVIEHELHFSSCDFRVFFKECDFKSEDFVYLDPPYLISNSEYNKLWSESDEKDLLELLDDLHSKGVKFAISNLIEHKGKENAIFKAWAKKYNVYDISSNYISYHDNKTQSSHREVLVTNYKRS
jgi:DNA adenine methylase Dam